jgi:hypothetical protein
MLETLEREVAQAEAILDALQIPEGKLLGQDWHRLALAERIQVLYERMLQHLRRAQAASAEQVHTTLSPLTTGQPVMVQAADAQVPPTDSRDGGRSGESSVDGP